jgi:hypothetical protein
MAEQVVSKPVVGQPGEVHTSAKNPTLTECPGLDANGKPTSYIYLQGCASTANGTAVTFDEAGATTLLAGNAKGPVAWATGAVDATTKYGWYRRKALGGASVVAAASSADNATLGRETADGTVGDGRAAGDQIVGAISRGASAGGAQLVQVTGDNPWVDDFQGA